MVNPRARLQSSHATDYLLVGQNLLLLDKDLEPRVGNGAWSFTLSRTH